LSRQIKLMTKSFSTPYDNFFRLLGVLHLFATLVVIIVSIVLL
jgi:hypothetical protein